LVGVSVAAREDVCPVSGVDVAHRLYFTHQLYFTHILGMVRCLVSTWLSNVKPVRRREDRIMIQHRIAVEKVLLALPTVT
jgi:hypothetical protein